MSMITTPNNNTLFGGSRIWLRIGLDECIYCVYVGGADYSEDWFGVSAFRIHKDGTKEWLHFPEPWRHSVGFDMWEEPNAAYVVQQAEGEKGVIYQQLPGYVPRFTVNENSFIAPYEVPNVSVAKAADEIARKMAQDAKAYTSEELAIIWNKLIEVNERLAKLELHAATFSVDTVADVLWNDQRAEDWLYAMLTGRLRSTIRGIIE